MKVLMFITVLPLMLSACGGGDSVTGSGNGANRAPNDGFADAVATMLANTSDVSKPVVFD